MKKHSYLFIILSLIAVDQGMKLLVLRFLQGNRLYIFGDFLKLKVVTNYSSMSLLSVMGMVFPPILAVGIKLAILLLAFWLIFYFRKTYGESTAWRVAFVTISAGVICAVLDSAAWKGTVDFIDFASSFVIDVKDIYLDIGCISLIVYALSKKIWISQKKKGRIT